jgi:hypothetical protein
MKNTFAFLVYAINSVETCHLENGPDALAAGREIYVIRQM